MAKESWSYSRLSTFSQCKYCYYLKYILKDKENYPQIGNFYADVGIFIHEILEKVFSGKMTLDEAAEYYAENFDKQVKNNTRQEMMDKTYELCANYFSNVELEWLQNYEIIGVEQKLEFEIDGQAFVGYVDLLLQNKDTGEIWLIDHKSKKYPAKKRNGDFYENDKKSFESYTKQMYLYGYGIKEKYGKYPSKITWNLFKDEGKLLTIPFDEFKFKETIDWILLEIKTIKKEKEFPANVEYFFCNNLCNFRECCEYKLLFDSTELGCGQN